MKLLNAEPKKNLFTRMCIGEAVVDLLQHADLKQLRVMAVAYRAGVSRMTFYKYYRTPQEALEDYLHIIIAEYISSSDNEQANAFLTYEHVLEALLFFDRYRTFFLTMKRQGLFSVLMDSVNEFLEKYMQTDRPISLYRRYSYAGGLLNCFLIWEENRDKERPEDVAAAICEIFAV